MKNLSSSLPNDGLTSGVFYEGSYVDAFVDGFTQRKSEIAESPKMSRKRGGGADIRESFFTTG